MPVGVAGGCDEVVIDPRAFLQHRRAGPTRTGVSMDPVRSTAFGRIPPARRLASLRVTLALGVAVLVTLQVPLVDAQQVTVGDDIAADVGIQKRPADIRTQGDAAVADFDGDGDLDMMLNHHLSGSDLYRYDRQAGRFGEVQVARFDEPPPGKSAADRHECAWADFDGDGRQDVYCGYGANVGRGESTKELWLQQPGGTFVNEAVGWGVEQRTQRSRDVVVLDANNDGLPDLFTGADPQRPDGRDSDNHLFINMAGERLRLAPEYGVNLPVGGASVSAGDFNGRGGDDLVACADPRYRPFRCSVYRNRHGEGVQGFADVSSRIPDHQTALDRVEDAEFADLDGDGRDELLIVQARMLRIYRWEEPAVRKVYELALESGGDVAVGRVTADRYPEIYVVQSGAGQDFILLNRGQRDDGQQPFTLTRRNTPEAGHGSGESVTAVEDFDEGRAAFVVNNGLHDVSGPRQFIVFPAGL